MPPVADRLVQDAYYKLDDPEVQIQAYAFDVVRSHIPSMDLDEAYADADTIAKHIQDTLHSQMPTYGYEIVKAPSAGRASPRDAGRIALRSTSMLRSAELWIGRGAVSPRAQGSASPAPAREQIRPGHGRGERSTRFPGDQDGLGGDDEAQCQP